MPARKLPLVEIGFPVFLSDGGDAFGAVRQVMPRGRPELIVNVEGSGDFRVPLEAIEKVVEKRVVVSWSMLDDEMQRGILHVLDLEDFPPAGEGEVELVDPVSDEEERNDEAFASHLAGGPRDTPPGEMPGRDVGSRHGAPPSVTTPRRPE